MTLPFGLWDSYDAFNRALEFEEEQDEQLLEETCKKEDEFVIRISPKVRNLSADAGKFADKQPLSVSKLIICTDLISAGFMDACYLGEDSQKIGLVCGGQTALDKEESTVTLKSFKDKTCFIYSLGDGNDVLVCQSKTPIKSEHMFDWVEKVFSQIKPEMVIVLTSTQFSKLQVQSNNGDDILRQLRSESFKVQTNIAGLEKPNLVKELPAAVMMYCQVHNVPAILYLLATQSFLFDVSSVKAYAPLLNEDAFFNIRQNTFKAAAMPDLEGKVAIITGASSGLGESTAVLFAKLGAKLVLAGRNAEALLNTKKQCQEINKKIEEPLCIKGDLVEEAYMKEIIDKTIEHFKGIDILASVNCAGIVIKGTIETTTLEQYDQIMNINVRTVFYLTHLAVPHLIKSKGNIVNVSSVNGIRAFAGVNAYCMTKSAVDQLTRCTALELASKGVRCNSVNPGVIKTQIHMRGGMDQAEYERFLEHSKSTHALGRVGEPIEVANAIAFLASNEASFITGASLPIDGGRHAMCPR
eukprot:gene158-770_t